MVFGLGLYATFHTLLPTMHQNRRLVLSFVLLFLVGAANSLADDRFDDLVARATAARSSSDPTRAVPLYEEALKIKPDWMEGLWLTGSLLYGADQYKDAAGYLRHLTAVAPQAAQAWALLGLCEYETSDSISSLEHIQRATSIGLQDQPQMSLVLSFHEAALLAKLGRFDESLDKYSAFFDARVTDPQVILGLGLVSLQRAITPSQVLPADHDLVLNAGMAFSAMLANDQPKARQLYEELVKQFPSDANVHYAYGYFLFGTDVDAAIEQWNRALALDPSNAGAHTLLAWTLSLRGDETAAVNHAKAAILQNPEQAVPQLVLGRALVADGHLDDGLPHIEQAVHLQPKNLEAHLALASAYSEAGRKNDAQKERQLCLTMQSEKHLAQQH